MLGDVFVLQPGRQTQELGGGIPLIPTGGTYGTAAPTVPQGWFPQAPVPLWVDSVPGGIRGLGQITLRDALPLLVVAGLLWWALR